MNFVTGWSNVFWGCRVPVSRNGRKFEDRKDADPAGKKKECWRISITIPGKRGSGGMCAVMEIDFCGQIIDFEWPMPNGLKINNYFRNKMVARNVLMVNDCLNAFGWGAYEM